MRRVLRLGTLLAALGLAACSTATPYQPAGDTSRFGYTDTKIDDDVWRLSFAGNAHTSREQVENAFLYRAAEIAAAAEADGFIVLDKNVDEKVQYEGTGFDPRSRFFGVNRSAFFSFDQGFRTRRFRSFPFSFGVPRPHLRSITNYTATAEIRVFDGEPPPVPGIPYNTEEVLENLGPKVANLTEN